MQIFNPEKRREIRLNLSAPVRYQIRGSQVFGNTVTRNISRGGTCFIADRFIKPETRLSVDVNILARSINSIGTVRWAEAIAHSDKYRLGVEFTILSPQDKNYLSDYLDMRIPKESM